jgi:hypothetical protein
MTGRGWSPRISECDDQNQNRNRIKIRRTAPPAGVSAHRGKGGVPHPLFCRVKLFFGQSDANAPLLG